MGNSTGARALVCVSRGGRVLKWKGRVASLAPSLFLATVTVAALSVGFASAEVVSTPQTGTVVFGIDEDNTITSTGSVDLTTGASTAVVIGTDYSSVFTNNGTISGPSSGNPDGFGVVLNGLLSPTGQIENNGQVDINSNSLGSAGAAGFLFVDDVAGDVRNAGAISASATGSGGASAAGLQFQVDLLGDFENSGTITAAADGASSAARAAGVFVLGLADGNVSNSGTINVRASGGSAVTAAGIALGDGLTNTFKNSGTIVANATLSQPPSGSGPFGSVPEATGVLIADTTTGRVINTGRITANVEAGSGASAAGVWLDDMQGQFSNSGVISAKATGGADAYGLYVDTFDGVISDVGQISASAVQGNAYAIFLNSGSGTLNVDSADQVNGLIRVQDHNVNLDAQGGSAVFFFEDAAPGSGAFSTTASDGRSGWFVKNPGGAAPVYAVVDSADVAPIGDLVAYYGSVVGRIGDVLRFDRPEEVSRGNAWGSVLNTFRPFAMIDAEARQFESDIGTETDVTLFNGNAGYSGQLDSGLAVAIGMGVFRADGDNSTVDFDTTGFYLDAALGRQFGVYTVEAGLGYGWLSTDRTRQINGSSHASADYDSTLLTAYLGVERNIDIDSNIAMLGFGDVRYTRQQDDAYSETGSAANASVGEITTEVIEARLGVEVERSLNNGGLLTGQLSGVLRRDLGDDSASVRVFSTTQALSFATTDFNGASLVLGYEKDLKAGMTFDLTAAQEFGDSAQGPNVRAGLRWSF